MTQESEIEEEQLGHLRAIQTEGLSCLCPLCSGELRPIDGKSIFSCSRDKRHWLTQKEIRELSLEECANLLKQRSLIWTCPYCEAKIVCTGEIGKCPSCERYIEPGLYGKREEFRGRT